MDQVKIGKFIAESRKDKDLTQRELGEKLGISKNAVSKWERGISMPDVSIMKELCNVLDISLNEFFNGESDNSDNGLINYLKTEKRKKKIKFIVFITIILLTIIISILSLFFINNYNKISGYILTGESENFTYRDNLFISSNIKNINAFGLIESKNENIKTDDITSMKLICNNKLIATSKYLKGVIYENNGYDELFDEKCIQNIDKWKMEVTYPYQNEEKTETIDLVVNNILKNDGLFYKKVDSITDGTDADLTWNKKREEFLENNKNELLNRGFTWSKNEAYKEPSHTPMGPINLVKEYKDGSYFLYRTRIGMWEYYKENTKYRGVVRSRVISTVIKNDKSEIIKHFSYNMNTGKFINCNKDCPNEYLNDVKEVEKLYKKEFDGLYYFTENEYVGETKLD